MGFPFRQEDREALFLHILPQFITVFNEYDFRMYIIVLASQNPLYHRLVTKPRFSWEIILRSHPSGLTSPWRRMG